MPFLTQGKTNWKYISIVLFLAVIAGGVIFNYFWQVKKIEQGTEITEVKTIIKKATLKTDKDSYKLGEKVNIIFNLGKGNVYIQKNVLNKSILLSTEYEVYKLENNQWIKLRLDTYCGNVDVCAGSKLAPPLPCPAPPPPECNKVTKQKTWTWDQKVWKYVTKTCGNVAYRSEELKQVDAGTYKIRVNYYNSNSCSGTQKYLETQFNIKDETANWKTYKNEVHGFEVKYPQDWKIIEGDGSYFGFEEKDFNVCFGSGCTVPGIVIELHPNENIETFWLWKIIQEGEESPTIKVIQKEIITIGNREITKALLEQASGWQEWNYLFNSPEIQGFTFFSANAEKRDQITCNLIAEKMLSTFRFFKKEKFQIISPAKGDKWERGKTYQIRWQPSDPEGSVCIKLYKEPYLSLNLAGEWCSVSPNTGNYPFTVFREEPGKYRFFIAVYGKCKKLIEGRGGYSCYEYEYEYRGYSDEFLIFLE